MKIAKGLSDITHSLVIKDQHYEYPAIRAVIRVNGVHHTFLRTYGTSRRTRKEALALCENWLAEKRGSKILSDTT